MMETLSYRYHVAHNTSKRHNSIWRPVTQQTVSHSCGTPVPRDPHPSCSAASRLENTISSYRPPFVCWGVRKGPPVAFHTHVAGWPSVRWCRVNSLAAETLLLPPNRLRPSFFAIFFERLDENPRNFRSEYLRTCPNFHYLDILLSHKYFRYFPLTRNVEVNLGPDGG